MPYCPKHLAYGGVVIDEDKVLLRRPLHQKGGYAWTFPKKIAPEGVSPESIAYQAIQVMSGVHAAIDFSVPGDFEGDLTRNRYFLMRVFDRNTKALHTDTARWADRREAEALIMQTTTPLGRQRDLEVLGRAFDLKRKLRQADQILFPHVHPQFSSTLDQLEDETLTLTALQFDHSKYEAHKDFDAALAFREYEMTNRLPEKHNMMRCIYNYMVRYLYQSEGRRLSRRSNIWRLFRECFFWICTVDVDSEYRNEDGYARWIAEILPHLPEKVAMVSAIHRNTCYLDHDEVL